MISWNEHLLHGPQGAPHSASLMEADTAFAWRQVTTRLGTLPPCQIRRPLAGENKIKQNQAELLIHIPSPAAT